MNIMINDVDFWDGFEPMRYWTPPKSYDQKKWKKELHNYMLSGDFIGARKVDGFWGMIIRDNDGNFHLRSRSENVDKTYQDKAEWIPWIISDLKDLPNNTVLIGEVFKPGDEGSRKITTILGCLKEKALARQESEPLHFYCFDCLAFDNKILIDTPIEKRVKILENDVAPLLKGNFTEVAKYVEGEELLETCYELLQAGYEGMVIQNKIAKYTCGKRTARLSIKVKKELAQTIDVFLDGDYKPPTRLYTGKDASIWNYYENVKTGEKVNDNMYAEYAAGGPWEPVTKAYYNGWAAAVSISLMKDGKPVHIGYISGIPDSMKEGIIKTPEEYKNKVYEVTCMEVERISNQYSLRHAKFVAPRPDKSYLDCDFSQIV